MARKGPQGPKGPKGTTQGTQVTDPRPGEMWGSMATSEWTMDENVTDFGMCKLRQGARTKL
ncbi:hypothetical protein VP1G_11519 [Cytospora mali]|nr:hypothetical protein VP1G_11519 [Valsa mali var. pyri (nom. inval.)]